MPDIYTPIDKTSPSSEHELWSAIAPYLPMTVLDTLRSHPAPGSPWISLLEGTLLLADVSGFTPLTEKLAEAGKEGAEWLTDIIDRYFHRMLDIASHYGGDNLKFGGDALLILFKGQSHAFRAVATALGMQRATQRFTLFRVGGHRIRLNMTVGVHSGGFYSAAAGLPGQLMQHFILGPDTNRVAEIQGSASAGQLIISPSTARLVGDLCVKEPYANGYLVHRILKNPFVSTIVERDDEEFLAAGTALIPYLPAQIAQGMRSGGSGQVRRIEGEHRKVIVTFLNLVGINELLAKHGPESMLKELQLYMMTLLQLCNEYCGFIAGNDIYTNGLKLILIFGAPVAHEDDAANALRLALELTRELPNLNIGLHHRIGINGGFVFAGDVGPPYRRQYTVMGDAVNLAARLMSSSSTNQILVSKQAIVEAGPSFLSEQLAPLKVKGKRDTISTYSLQGEYRTSPVSTESGGIVFGRQNEIELFQKTCLEVNSGKGRIVVVSGDTGIGKSRLIRAFQEHANRLGWIVLSGRCELHTASKPFTPWIEILNSFFAFDSSDSIESKSRKVLDSIRQNMPEFAESASLLNPLLALSIPQSDMVRSIDSEERRHRLLEIVSCLLQNSAVKRPTFIVIEDVNWSDYSSLDLISYIGAHIDSSHLLMCLSYRLEKEIKMSLPSASTVKIALQELPLEVAIPFVRSTLGRPQLPDHIATAIFSKAKGNPLFMEEIAISIQESGTLDTMLSASAFELSKVMASLDIPDRLQTLIMSRIDTLNNVMKEVVRTASVIGNVFDVHTLKPLLSARTAGVNLEHCLQELTHLDFVVQEYDLKEATYRFKHALIHEIAYDSLLFARRRELHRRVAAYIEEANKDDLEPVYEILAHHYSRGRDNTRAQLFALRSAEKAQQVFSHEEAIDYYKRGLDTIEDKSWHGLSLRSYIIERIGDCYEGAGQHGLAVKSFNSALRAWRSSLRHGVPAPVFPALNEAVPAKVRQSDLCRKIGVSYERHSEYDSSLKWLESALRALPVRQPSQAASIWVAKSLALFRKGLYDESIRCGRIGLALSRRISDTRQRAYAHNILATSYRTKGALNLALRHRSRALRLYQEVGDFTGQAVANNNLANCYQAMGFLDNALRHYRASLEGFQRVGNPIRVAIVHNNIGELLLIQGRLQESIESLQKVVETYEKLGDPLAATGLALINLSRAYQRQRDYRTSMEHLQKGIELLRKSHNRGLIAEAFLQQADLELETGQGMLSRQTHQRAMREVKELGMKLLEARGLNLQGRIALTENRLEEAEVCLQESGALSQRHGWKYEQGLALLFLAGLYARKAASNSAARRRYQTVLRQATEIFRRMGAEAELERIYKLTQP